MSSSDLRLVCGRRCLELTGDFFFDFLGDSAQTCGISIDFDKSYDDQKVLDVITCDGWRYLVRLSDQELQAYMVDVEVPELVPELVPKPEPEPEPEPKQVPLIPVLDQLKRAMEVCGIELDEDDVLESYVLTCNRELSKYLHSKLSVREWSRFKTASKRIQQEDLEAEQLKGPKLKAYAELCERVVKPLKAQG